MGNKAWVASLALAMTLRWSAFLTSNPLNSYIKSAQKLPAYRVNQVVRKAKRENTRIFNLGITVKYAGIRQIDDPTLGHIITCTHRHSGSKHGRFCITHGNIVNFS